MQLSHLIRAARRRLAEAPFQPLPREATLLAGHVLGLTEAQVMARGDAAMERAAHEAFEALLTRRLAGEPVAYLTGEREFYGRPFRVDRSVLIPRPETEHLVEVILGLALPAAPRILDVGTGSGCLAVTLALELPRAFVVASDLSPGALRTARSNARRLGAAPRVRLVAADLTAALRLERFDAVVSNPPYIAPEELPDLSPEVRDFEPRLALVAPEHGLGVIRRLLAEARALRPGAILAFEIGAGQGAAVTALVQSSAGLELLEIRPDYAGIPRVVVLKRA